MTWKKAFALLLVIAILGAGVYYMREMEQDDSRNLKELYSEVEPLQRQREALVAERDSLEVDYALQMRDVEGIPGPPEKAEDRPVQPSSDGWLGKLPDLRKEHQLFQMV